MNEGKGASRLNFPKDFEMNFDLEADKKRNEKNKQDLSMKKELC
tara:strand:+ start:361 stop:492 length:132 start_codon:yes stop_codon:yes gene_type:complete